MHRPFTTCSVVLFGRTVFPTVPREKEGITVESKQLWLCRQRAKPKGLRKENWMWIKKKKLQEHICFLFNNITHWLSSSSLPHFSALFYTLLHLQAWFFITCVKVQYVFSSTFDYRIYPVLRYSSLLCFTTTTNNININTLCLTLST